VAGGTVDTAWSADLTWGALLAQAGVVRVDTLPELMDVSRVLLDQPVPPGRRVAVISNSRGATTLTEDAVAGASLTMARLGEGTRGAIADAVPSGWRVDNPVELPFDAGPAEYATAVGAVCADPGVDAVLVVYAPATRDHHEEVGRAIAEVTSARVPVVATFLGATADRPVTVGEVRIPLFDLPGDAVRVLGRLASHGEWLAQPAGTVPEPADLGIDVEGLGAVVAEALGPGAAADGGGAAGGRWLSQALTERFVAAAGLPSVWTVEVRSPEEAVAAAVERGWPVVLKAGRETPYFRALAGGVALDLRDAEDVRAGWRDLAVLHGEAAMASARLQAMSPGGVDAFLAVHRQTDLGALVSVGLGGIAAEGAEANRPVWVLPLSDTEAVRLVARSPLAAPLAVSDPDGRAAVAVAALAVRLAAVVDAVPELADLVANPVVAGAEGAHVTDVRIRVAPARVDDAPAVRRLH
jgi:acyl-CoA synthetase (NDP forming)